MKVTAAVLSTMLVGALAAPQSLSNANARNARRSARKTLAARDELNENWAGATIESFDSGEILKSVNATFTVPNPEFPSTKSDSYTEYTTSAWVGIDGDGCDNLWQTGIDSTILPNGDVSYYAWYEWYPADTQVFDLGTITTGDVINIAVIAESTTKGTAIIENTTSGKTVSKTMTSTDTLCLVSAEWIIEDLSIDDSSIGLANVGNFTFEKAVAGTSTRNLGPSGATIMDVELTGTTAQLTQTTVTEDSVIVAVNN